MKRGFHPRPALTGLLRVCRAGGLLLAAAVLCPTAADTITPTQGPGLLTELRTGGGLPPPAVERPEPSTGAPAWDGVAGVGRQPAVAQRVAAPPPAVADQEPGARWEGFGEGAFAPSVAAGWLAQGGAVLLLYWLARRWRRPARW